MNLCFFSGRLTADAKINYTKSQTGIINFTLAVDSGFGEYKKTSFLKCNLWKRDKLLEYLTKGKPIIITAEFQEKEWQDKEGNKRKTPEFTVKEVEFQQGEKRFTAQGEPQPQKAPDSQQEEREGAKTRSPMDEMDGAPF